MPDNSLPASTWDALRQLSHSDGERAGILSALAHARQHAAHDERLESARASFADVERRLAETAAHRRELEATIEDAKLRTRRTETRLASGKLQAHREIEAAQHEISTLQDHISESESAWVDASEQEESLAASVKAARTVLDEEEQSAAVRRSKAEDDVRDAERRLASIDASRREAAQKLPAAIRDRYRQLYPKMGGRPFAEAAAGECSHCGRAVPADAMQILRSRSGVPSCPSCARLLLLP